MPFFRLCVLCDASLNSPAGVAGIGVVIKLVNRDNCTDDHPLLFAWTKLTSPSNRPDLAEEQAILFASILSNHLSLRGRIREICGPNNLISATVLNDCQSAVNRTRISLREDPFLKQLVEELEDRYGTDLEIVWESNHNHAQQHCLALVDEMANQARLQLPNVGQEVYARDANGLADWLRYRRTEAEAAARAQALEAPF